MPDITKRSEHTICSLCPLQLPSVRFVCFQLLSVTKCYWHSSNKALGQSLLEPYVWTGKHFVFGEAINVCRAYSAFKKIYMLGYLNGAGWYFSMGFKGFFKLDIFTVLAKKEVDITSVVLIS